MEYGVGHPEKTTYSQSTNLSINRYTIILPLFFILIHSTGLSLAFRRSFIKLFLILTFLGRPDWSDWLITPSMNWSIHCVGDTRRERESVCVCVAPFAFMYIQYNIYTNQTIVNWLCLHVLYIPIRILINLVLSKVGKLSINDCHFFRKRKVWIMKKMSRVLWYNITKHLNPWLTGIPLVPAVYSLHQELWKKSSIECVLDWTIVHVSCQVCTVHLKQLSGCQKWCKTRFTSWDFVPSW